MAFKKNQKVLGVVSGDAYRIESGPHRRLSDGEGGAYLMEKLSGDRQGDYILISARALRPQPIRQGDMGRLVGTCWEHYSPHRLVYLDSKVILLEDKEGDYMSQTGEDRERILASWEPVE